MTLGRNDTVFTEQSAGLIDQAGLVLHITLAHAMQALYVRLLEGFDRHGQNIGSMRGLGDGNRIIVVAFVTTHEGGDMLCR